jgi:uncharacterized protein YjiS (DUF1127 family)
MLLSIIRAFAAYRAYRRQVQALAELSDRELADIGLERPQLPRAYADRLRDDLMLA